MKITKKLIPLFLLLILVGGGCSNLRNRATPTNTSTSTIISNQVNIEEEKIDTSDWSTYLSTRYTRPESYDKYPLFSIKYPKDWLVDEGLGGPTFYTPALPQGDRPEKLGDIVFYIGGVYDNPVTATTCLDSIKKRNPLYKVENVYFFDYQGLDSVVFNEVYNNTKNRIYCFTNKKNSVSIHARMVTNEKTDIFDAIAKTFKFL